VALGLLLDAVIADCCRSIETLGDLSLGDRFEVAGLCSVVRPDAGQAVSLQLNLNGQTLGACSAGAGAGQNSDQVLHVMAVFMRQHVGFGKGPTLRTEPGLKPSEKVEVQVDLPIGRAVEGADRGCRLAAGGLDCSSEEDGIGLDVLSALPRKLICPEGLDAVDKTHDSAVLTGIGIRTGLALAGQVAGLTRLSNRCVLWRLRTYTSGCKNNIWGRNGDPVTAAPVQDRPPENRAR